MAPVAAGALRRRRQDRRCRAEVPGRRRARGLRGMRRPSRPQARSAGADRRGRPQGHRGALARQAGQGRGEHRRHGRGRGPGDRDRADDALRALDHADLRAEAFRHLVLPGRGAGGPDRPARRVGVRRTRSGSDLRKRSRKRRPASGRWSTPRRRTSSCWPRARRSPVRSPQRVRARSSRCCPGSRSRTARSSCTSPRAPDIAI